jgi:hypothetical protein
MVITPPDPLTPEQLQTYFPLQRAALPDTFELGLVLGGTVSAGAYTAGVLDYLMQVLDAWTAARERGDPQAPRHKVVISTIGGASGGAINAAMVARAAGWGFPRGADSANPFYSGWTDGVDLVKLLDPKPEPDIEGLASAFNCSAIDTQAASTIAFRGTKMGQGGAPAQRSYFSNPLRLIMTVGNITGLPYRINFRGETQLGHDMVAHADIVRFALAVDGGVPNPPGDRPDEFALNSYDIGNWDRLAAAALATSAFPLAFRSRPLSRPLAVSGYQVAVIPSDDNRSAEIAQLIPRWDTLMANQSDPLSVSFVNVDGGTLNNDPLDHVRTALAGLYNRNTRDGTNADRAVILVAPFSDPETLGPTQPPDLFGLAMPFVMSLIYQGRYKPEDIALADAEDVYSRFLIAPVGPGPNGQRTLGKAAIASGALGGFSGFIDRSFLDYDFRLGQRNAYEFLSRHLVFPETNLIFQGKWTDAQKQAQSITDTDGSRLLRLIPIMDTVPTPPQMLPTPKPANAPPGAVAWPKLPALPDNLSDAISGRLDAVYSLLMRSAKQSSWWKQAIASTYVRLGWTLYVRGALRDKALNAIRSGLQHQNLL